MISNLSRTFEASFLREVAKKAKTYFIAPQMHASNRRVGVGDSVENVLDSVVFNATIAQEQRVQLYLVLFNGRRQIGRAFWLDAIVGEVEHFKLVQHGTE